MLYDYNQAKNNFFDSLYTTNNQTIQIILNCMENTLINKNNNKIYKIMISRYFQMWRSIFYKYNSNDISNEIDKWLKDLTNPRIKYETFSYPIIFGNIQIYSCFDIEYIKKSHQKFHKVEICQLLQSLDENEIPDNIDEYDSTCLNGFPLAVVESVQKPKPYKIIDGNHRFYFINKQDIKDYPVNVIHLSSLTEEMFINKFNFCIYLFYNLINYFNDCNNLLSMIFEFKKCKKILISFNLL